MSTADTANCYPCPFCKRTYTNWGFRRRHIKLVHCPTDSLPCKLCGPHTGFTLEQWIFHRLDEHQVDSGQVQQEVAVYKEAKIVLQDNARVMNVCPGADAGHT